MLDCTRVQEFIQLCKEDVAHKYSRILLPIKRNEIELFVVRWMGLESVIQSEVSQREKNKWHVLTHMYVI